MGKKAAIAAFSILQCVAYFGVGSAYAEDGNRTVRVSRIGVYRYVGDCSGMKNYITKTLAQAETAENKACDNCVVAGEESSGDYVDYPELWVECYRFANTPVGAWYVSNGALDYVTSHGIMNVMGNGGFVPSGYGNGRFGSNDAATREQLACMLRNYAANLGLSVIADGSSLPSQLHWHRHSCRGRAGG